MSLSYEDRRLRIIDKAAQAFAVGGYDATSIDDILAATGLTKGGLYYYIAGKTDLLLGVHDRCMLPLLAEIESLTTVDLEPEELLRGLARIMVQNLYEYNDHVRVVLREWRRMTGHPKWPIVRAQRDLVESLIQRTLAKGVELGNFRAVDPRLTSLAFIGMMNYGYFWIDIRKGPPAMALADSFVDIFLGGIVRRAELNLANGEGRPERVSDGAVPVTK